MLQKVNLNRISLPCLKQWRLFASSAMFIA